MKFKSALIIVLLLIVMGMTVSSKELVFDSNQIRVSIDILNGSGLWNESGTVLVPRNAELELKIPDLASCDTIDTDVDGVLSCGTDNTGGLPDTTYYWQLANATAYYNSRTDRFDNDNFTALTSGWDTSSADDFNFANNLSVLLDNSTINRSIDLGIYNHSITCIGLTGSADLCDGSDDGGGSTNCSVDQSCNQVYYVTDNSSMKAYVDTFNSSIDLSNYNYSLDLSIYNHSITCVQLTGSQELCDGSDNTGGDPDTTYYWRSANATAYYDGRTDKYDNENFTNNLAANLSDILGYITANEYWVNISGDIMTGALVVDAGGLYDISGGTDTNDMLVLRPNVEDGKPQISLYGNGDGISINPDAGENIIFVDDNTGFATWNIGGSSLHSDFTVGASGNEKILKVYGTLDAETINATAITLQDINVTNNLTIYNNMSFANLLNCDVLATDTNGVPYCDADATAEVDTTALDIVNSSMLDNSTINRSIDLGLYVLTSDTSAWDKSTADDFNWANNLTSLMNNATINRSIDLGLYPLISSLADYDTSYSDDFNLANYTALNLSCEAITGSADLCDGSDDGSSGGTTYENENFTANYDARTDRWQLANLSAQITNYDTSYADDFNFVNNLSALMDNSTINRSIDLGSYLMATSNHFNSFWSLSNYTALNLSCESITGSPDLCDGSDDGGGNCSADQSCDALYYVTDNSSMKSYVDTFNKSVMLTNYNFSIDLGGYNYSLDLSDYYTKTEADAADDTSSFMNGTDINVSKLIITNEIQLLDGKKINLAVDEEMYIMYDSDISGDIKFMFLGQDLDILARYTNYNGSFTVSDSNNNLFLAKDDNDNPMLNINSNENKTIINSRLTITGLINITGKGNNEYVECGSKRCYNSNCSTFECYNCSNNVYMFANNRADFVCE